MATQLSVYNGALRLCGERELGSLTENRKPTRVCNGVWRAADGNGFVKFLLEQGQWNFAMRTAVIDFNPDLATDFGYQYVFDKPDDWVRTCGVSLDEYFRDPLIYYDDEVEAWYCDSQSAYFRWVSNGVQYGGDLSKWPETFNLYAETELAARICMTITHDKDRANELMKEAEKVLKLAKSIDAMNEPTKFPPVGSNMRARRSRTSRGCN